MASSQVVDACPSIGVSISDSPDIHSLGLSKRHLRDAMAEIALHLLSKGISLAYGGDLRQHGFTHLLAELMNRYQNHPQHNGSIEVVDYLAWPVHISMTTNELSKFSSDHKHAARLIFLTLNGTRLDLDKRMTLRNQDPREDEWIVGLTAMRKAMRNGICARVVLGGTVTGFKGSMPGIAEETYLSLEAHQPVYLLGGFGGCTRDIAETIGMISPWAGSRDNWSGRKQFRSYTPDDLRNGLTQNENMVLAETPHIGQAASLVVRGLGKAIRNKFSNA